jgi:mRNA-degrading endonuclease RelE of RelBE toxin-antitoxin system
MKTRVVVGAPVKAFLSSLAPEPRRKLRRAIKELAAGKGDVRQLEGNLVPFWRLRVGSIRVIFDQKSTSGERTVFCFFADYRATVYLVLEQLLASGLLEQLED